MIETAKSNRVGEVERELMEQTSSIETSALKRTLIVRIEARAPWATWNEYFDNSSVGWPMSRYALEMGVLLEGRLRRHYQGVALDVEPGQAWLNGMWETQNWEVLEGPCRELVFFISPEVLLNLHLPEMPEVEWLRPFMVSPQLRPQVGASLREYTRGLAEQVVELRRQWLVWASSEAELPEIRLRQPGQSYRVPRLARDTTCVQLRLIMTQLLMCLLEEWHPATEAMRREPFSQISPAIQQALGTRELVTVSDAARLCGLNRNLFARRFREMMGLTFSEFSLHHRLNGVTDDLGARHETIEVIATRWGFVNGSHLHRCFVQNYGCTPAQFRRLHHEKRQSHWNTSRLAVALSHPPPHLNQPA